MVSDGADCTARIATPVIIRQFLPAYTVPVDVTVCICTHNRPSYVRDCLEGLRQQTAAPEHFNILIVDSASDAEASAELAALVPATANARIVRVEQPGLSLARNAGADAADSDYIAYIDDDAIPEPDWIERILDVAREFRPALIGGRILPRWEAPLPGWWPPKLRGTLTIIEAEGQGEYRTSDLPAGMEPYGANLIVHLPALRAIGGFGRNSGRVGKALLSDEEVQLAWRLQAAGYSARYDSRIVVRHQIQAARLTPSWLLSRLYWQGVSTVLTRRQLGCPHAVWRELPRRLAVTALLWPTGLISRRSPRLLACRWRLAYAAGFVRAALGPKLPA
jgi:glycosyltransferase involved in cell wall biosynthesis